MDIFLQETSNESQVGVTVGVVWSSCVSHSYYQLEDSSQEGINKFLTRTVNDSLNLLQDSHCISIGEVSLIAMVTDYGCYGY